MVRRSFYTPFLVLLCLVVSVSAFAQTTATLNGTVTTDGAPLPGATITISSPAMQGTRTTVSGANGDYVFPALPPGTYTVQFELQGLQTVKQKANVRLGETARADADLKVSKVSEAITVTASAPSVLETPTVSTNLTREQVEALPVGRTIAQRIQIAPGLTNSGVNNQTIINGAPSYDNLYMVNGVVVNDTLRGQPEGLFIEDAIQETSLLTAGVSAEYGRFTGGVVNTITKSGGNEFSGSLRSNFTNDAWSKVTDFKDPVTGVGQPKPTSVLNKQYEATLGGYLMKDRLWFFGAGRKFDQSLSRTLTATNLPYEYTNNNKRYEAKLTGQITSKHSIVGSYLKNDTTETNYVYQAPQSIDVRSLTDRSTPNWLEDFHYSGIITNNFLIEGLYSRRYFAFVGGGGPQDLINGTLLRDNSNSRRMWSPTFCGTCDPKTRNNKDLLGKVNYFLSTQTMGSHSIVAGYDEFTDLRHENNYQSGSNYRIWGYFSTPDANKNVYMSMDPTRPGFVTYNPILMLSQTSNIKTKSAFVNDKWDLNQHFSFNLGARLDKNDALDQSHNPIANSSAVSPRLAAIYDVNGKGTTRVSASYAKYVAKLDAGVADTVSVGGNPGSIYFNYHGPAINPLDSKGNVIGTPVPTDQVIKMVFDWFNSVGGANGYKDIDSIFMPGLTEKVTHSLKSPAMNELSIGVGQQLGTNGFVRADLIHRSWGDFYIIRRDTTTGQGTSASGSKVDVGILDNSSSGLSRKYDGLQLQANYRISRLNLGGNYTWSKLKGNVEGETSNNATGFVGNFQYPEYLQFAQNQPSGYLNEDIRHRVNLFANYDWALPFGSLNLGVLERYHSGTPYSAAAALDLRAGAAAAPPAGAGGITNPGYATPPSSSTYYFSGRGAYRLDSISATDLTAQLNFHAFKNTNLYVRGDLVNAFNQQGVEFASTSGGTIETRVYTRKQRAKSTDNLVNLVPFDPKTQTPVQYIPGVSSTTGTYNYQLDPNFGKATSTAAYQQPRTYRAAVGIRF